MSTDSPITPKDRAIGICHMLFKKKHHSWFTAASDTVDFARLMLAEAKYADNAKAIEYWKEVKKAAKKL